MALLTVRLLRLRWHSACSAPNVEMNVCRKVWNFREKRKRWSSYTHLYLLQKCNQSQLFAGPEEQQRHLLEENSGCW